MSARFVAVGAVLVNDSRRSTAHSVIFKEDIPLAPFVPAESVETVGVLELIAAYQEEVGNGRFPPLPLT